MRKSTRIVRKYIAIILIVLMSINSFGAVVSDNDGSAFITKAEFDSLKNNFQSQIDQYNTSIDSKIDGAISSYLSGLHVAKQTITSPLFAKPFAGAVIESIGSGDSRFFKQNNNKLNLSFIFIDAYIRPGLDTPANGFLYHKSWSYNMKSATPENSELGKRILCEKTEDGRWRIKYIADDYYETHDYFGGGHYKNQDYGFNGDSTTLRCLPWIWVPATNQTIDISVTNTRSWATNLATLYDGSVINSMIPTQWTSYRVGNLYTKRATSSDILIFDDANEQFVFDYNNFSLLTGNNANLTLDSCYDTFIRTDSIVTPTITYAWATSGSQSTAGTVRTFIPYNVASKWSHADDGKGTAAVDSTRSGENSYPPMLSPIDLNKSKLSDILSKDGNKYSYTDNGIEKVINGYGLCAGFPFICLTADESEIKWRVYNAGIDGKIYFKTSPFKSGVVEADCLYTQLLTPGDNTIVFETDKKTMIWVKWDIGVKINVDKSSNLILTEE